MNQQQQEVRLDISQTTPIVCECGSRFFQEAMMLRKWSRFASGLPTDQNVPIPVMICIECKKINEETLPPAVKALLDEENN
jgi:DNA-directed RNA polymerase subunit RPC12/RpoP